MAEPQYSPTVLVSGVITTVNGVEFQTADAQFIGSIAGLADDRVFSELLRVTPYDGTTVYKAIFPYRYNGAASVDPVAPVQSAATIASSGSANGSIVVNPFRAVVGSRTPASAVALDNYRDIRSGLFVPPLLRQTIALTPNTYSGPRLDLVYATFSVDVQASSVLRRVKSASDQSVTATTLYKQLVQVVSVSVVPGVGGSSPVIPTIPVDAGGNFNIPLAVIRVPVGFTGVSTVSRSDIRDYVNAKGLNTRVATESPSATGGIQCAPANGNNDGEGTYAAYFPWAPGSAGVRPSVWLPPQMVGGAQLFCELDFMTPGAYSHPNGTIVDSSRDWRNRVFLIFVAASGLAAFANDPAATASTAFPSMTGNCVTLQAMGQSFRGNSGLANVMFLNHSNLVTIPSGGAPSVLLNVDLATGNLVVGVNSAPACQLFVWLMATAAMPNA